MNLSIVGIGYVGTVCSACFAEEGHNVIGVDVDKCLTKINGIKIV
jgi:GDP-mannose 6-dehydrogenase